VVDANHVDGLVKLIQRCLSALLFPAFLEEGDAYSPLSAHAFIIIWPAASVALKCQARGRFASA
jgi:hypothetical protein